MPQLSRGPLVGRRPSADVIQFRGGVVGQQAGPSASRRVAHVPNRVVNSRPDILFVSHRIPFPPDKPGRSRTFHLVRQLGRYANVHLASLTDAPVAPEATRYLSGECVQFAAFSASRWAAVHAIRSLAFGGTMSVGASRSSDLATTIRQWAAGTRFVAAVASAASVAPYLRLPGLEGVRTLVGMAR